MKENENNQNDTLYIEERQNHILSLIKEKNRMTVKELSRIFNTSEVTIRNDLKFLSEAGKIIRTHGGAITSETVASELPISQRKSRQKELKAKIGEKAAELVLEGEVIFIDASTTAGEMIPYLKDKNEVTVITNGLDTAYRLSTQTNLTVILLGGIVRKESLSLVEGGLDTIVPPENIGKAFFGAWGFSLDEGFTDMNPREIELKKNVAERSRMRILLADSSKWGKVSYGTFVPVDKADLVITDNNAPQDMVKNLKEKGIKIFLV